MGVGMPPVRAVGDLQGANQSNRFDLAVTLGIPETLEGIALLNDQIGEPVPVAVGEGEGDQDTDQTLRLGPGDGLFNLQAAAFLYAGGADRTGPDRAAGDQTGIERGVVLLGIHDVDVSVLEMPTGSGAMDVPRILGPLGQSVTAEDVTGLALSLEPKGTSGATALLGVLGRRVVRGFRISP